MINILIKFTLSGGPLFSLSYSDSVVMWIKGSIISYAFKLYIGKYFKKFLGTSK